MRHETPIRNIHQFLTYTHDRFTKKLLLEDKIKSYVTLPLLSTFNERT